MAASPIAQLGFGKTTMLGMKMHDWPSATSMEAIYSPNFKMPILKDNIQDQYKNGMPLFATIPAKAVNESTQLAPTIPVYPMQILNRCFSVTPTLNLSFVGTSSPTHNLTEEIIDYTDGTDQSHVFNTLSCFTKHIKPMGVLTHFVNPNDVGLRSGNFGLAMYGPIRGVPNIWGSRAEQNTVVGFIIHKVKQTPILDLLSETGNVPYGENTTIDESYIMEPYVFDEYHQTVRG